MERPLSKAELFDIMPRFIRDLSRGISVQLFCDAAGVDEANFRAVFLYGTKDLTETVQRRISRAYFRHMRGELKVMKNPDNTRFVAFREKPKPVYSRSQRLVFENGAFKVETGIINRRDYSRPSLDEQLKRG